MSDVSGLDKGIGVIADVAHKEALTRLSQVEALRKVVHDSPATGKNDIDQYFAIIVSKLDMSR